MTTLATADLFDPRHYAAVRRPLLEAETLPPWCYTSEDFYRREVERIFMRCWNFIGRADQVAKPGDYLAFEFCGVPVVIVRGDDGEVRAFCNSCRHRGSQIAEGSGNCRHLVCPYHSWTYSLKGELIGAPEMQDTRGFERARHGLVPLALKAWGGFLFINFDAEPSPFEDYIGSLPQTLKDYDLDNLVCVRRQEFEMDCNWKLFVENAKEAYHIATVHRETINKYASVKHAGYAVEEADGEYCITFAGHEGSMALLKGAKGFPTMETLKGREAAGTTSPLLYPSTYLAFTVDCAWYLELHPMGPHRTKLVHGGCFPRSRLERPDFAEIAANYFTRWDITIAEDIRACNLQQKGVSSPFCRPGRFSRREPLVHEIDNWILDRVLG